MTRVAALYVDPRGPYPALRDVDYWTAERDARGYAGPYPVVAHPPCAGWGMLRHLAANDNGRDACGPRAVGQVRQWRGVLEQPAHSQLWTHCELPRPDAAPDRWGGYAIEVAQCAWGHPARKRTWLYLVGVPRALVERTRRHGGTPTHWCSGGGTARGRPPPGIKICSPQQRNRTPAAFARWLVRLARAAGAA